ncbi:MAG TPA: hypothetical protein VKV95_01165 [Terriglobia bacterium]|nr:hypothetical protein [Terriglobia bacterium]
MTLIPRVFRGSFLLIFIVLSSQCAWAQAAAQTGQTEPPAAKAQPPAAEAQPPAAGQNPPQATPSQDIPTQKIEAPPANPAQPATLSNVTGSIPPAEMQDLLKKVRFAEYRINDLLTDVRPERWKIPDATLESFRQTLKTLHEQVTALEQWRGQFEQRTDSLYLGFQTYSTINQVLPRLNGVAQSVGEHETAGYAAQFSKVWDQLFDLQQSIGRHVSSLMQSQDQVLADYTNNMAECQQRLSVAMRGQGGRAAYTRNSQPIRPLRRGAHASPAKASGSEKQKEENKPEEKKTAPPANPAAKK